jgi:spore coat protein CotH
MITSNGRGSHPGSCVYVLRAGVLAAVLWSVLAVLSAAPGAALSSDDFFDQSVLHDIRLVMKQEDWAALQAAYMEDTYYRADMQWRDQTVPIVGVRSRGSGSRNPHKPGLKIDFGRYVDQKFLGLKSLALANGWQDPSLMKQRISMLFYNRMGIQAPRVIHARIFINDEYLGLYQVMEPLDKNFLARIYGKDADGKSLNGGYLYEYHWKDAYDFGYLGSSLQIYLELFEPKTREDEAPSILYGPLEQLFKTLNEVRASDFERVVGELVDLPAFVKYLAVDNFLADFDGFLGYWGPNNFYVYRQQGRKDLVVFPWDKDLAFWAPDYDIEQGVAGNVLARRAFEVPSLRRAYLETLAACARSAMEPLSVDDATGWLEAEALREIAQFHDAGLADRQKSFSNERMDDEIEKVLRFARGRGPYALREAEKSLERLGSAGRHP